MRVDRILLPTDFSPASTEALERAVGLAVQHGAILTVFHVERAGPDAAALAVRRKEIQAHIAELIAAVTPKIGFAVRFASIETASALDGIMAQISRDRPDVVVMATHGTGMMTRSLAEAVVRDAPCSVLTCHRGGHGRWPWEPGRVLVLVDFSESSRDALAIARKVAGHDCPITLLHVADVAPPADGAGPRQVAIDRELEARIERHLVEWAGRPVDSVVAVRGPFRPSLQAQCRKLDVKLLVVGTHGLQTDPDEDAPSTAEHMTRTAAPPVLTAR
jgi:nucleotide-binding universal stress UspA family protein